VARDSPTAPGAHWQISEMPANRQLERLIQERRADVLVEIGTPFEMFERLLLVLLEK
jgi:hypothetical protein